MASTDRRYWAFISYSHNDEQLAQRLRDALESYTIPSKIVGRPLSDGEVIPRRLHPVFRDRDDLSSGSDLSGRIRDALQRSRTLIVVCSPTAARSRYVRDEIREFHRLHRSSRIFSIIVSGEPHAESKGLSEELECFPEPLRLNDWGTGGRTMEPCAADARPGKDGWKRSVTKLLSGIIEQDFDTLWQREQTRLKTQRARLTLLLAAFLITFLLSYVGVADAGLNVPLAGSICRYLDRHGMTVFRPIPSDREVSEQASLIRRDILDFMMAYGHGDLVVRYRPEPTAPEEIDFWTSSQMVTAIGAAPESTPSELRRASLALIALEQHPHRDETAGTFRGWYWHRGSNGLGSLLMWFLNANAQIAARNDDLSAEDVSRVEQRIELLQSLLKFYQSREQAAYNLFLDQVVSGDSHPYVTALAVEALLAMREGLPDKAARKQHDELVSSLCTWLIQQFDTTPSTARPGWRKSVVQDDAVRYDGMTLQIYAILLHAEQQHLCNIPKELIAHCLGHVLECGHRTLQYENTSAEFKSLIRKDGGLVDVSESVELSWHVWSIACTQRLLNSSHAADFSHEHRAELRRARHHLAVKLGREAVQEYQKRWPWMISELLYCLNTVTH